MRYFSPCSEEIYENRLLNSHPMFALYLLFRLIIGASSPSAAAAQDGESALVCITTTSSRPPTAAYRFSNDASSSSSGSSASSGGSASGASSSAFLTPPLLGAADAASDIGAPVSPRATATGISTNTHTASADVFAQYRGLTLPVTTGLAGYVVKTGRAVRINAAVTTDWRYDASVDRRPGIAQINTVLRCVRG